MSQIESVEVEGAEPPEVDAGEADADLDLPGPDVDGTPDDDGEDDPDADPDAEPEGEPEGDGDEQMRQRAALDEKAIEKRHRALGKENERHATAVGRIMENDVADLIPCPVCMDGIAGWVYPPDVAEPTEEQVSRIRQFAGLPDYSNFQEVGWATECPECHGFGKVKTGSRVPGAETTGCLTCNERGWINTRGMVPPPNGLTHPEGEILTGPTVLGTEPDERIAALQRDGFTVIPPMQFAPR